MSHYRITVKSPWTPEQAYDYLADWTNLAHWDPGTKSVVQQKRRGPVVGATYEVQASGGKLVYELERLDPPKTISAVGRSPIVHSVDSFTIASTDGGGSEVVYDADLTLRGPLVLLNPLLSWWLGRKLGPDAERGLTAALEGEKAA